jgi:uncharacterized protein YceK
MRTCVPFLILLVAMNFIPKGHAQSFNTIYTFPSESVGYEATGVPYIGSGGVLYGTTPFGGPNTPCSAITIGCGTVFSLTPPAQPGGLWTQSILYTFQGAPDAAEPGAGVKPGPNGTLMGTTTIGGPVSLQCPGGCGTLFQLTPPAQNGGAWTEAVVYKFLKADEYPYGLFAGANGILYGTAQDGGGSKTCYFGCGSVYELVSPATGEAWSLTQIHEFALETGEYPNAPLVAGANGVLYGTTQDGGNDSHLCGSAGCGTIFSLTPPIPPATSWTSQDIYRFKGGSDGWEPATGLILGPNGTLYGTTYYGGTTGCAGGDGCGTVFSLTPPTQSGEFWTKTVLYSFQGGNDGNYPLSYVGDLVVGTGGIIDGTTVQGGGTGCSGQGCGTLFQLTPPVVTGGSWTESILHAFTGGADGQNPFSGPAIDPNGVLYGFANGGTATSCSGGGCGVVYQYIP